MEPCGTPVVIGTVSEMLSSFSIFQVASISLTRFNKTRFTKTAIPNNKFRMAKWTRKPLAYRESNNFLIYV